MPSMNRFSTFALVAALVLSACSKRVAQEPPRKKLVYPATRTVDHVDTYHGVEVADPYRWLEDDNSAETKQWVAAQNELTFSYLKRIKAREPIRERIKELLDYERRGVPSVENGRYLFTANSGLQDQSPLYVADGVDEDPRLLIDPNALSSDGTVSLRGRWLTQDGRLLAYAISRAGSDWREFKVMDVATGKDLAVDHIKNVKFSDVSWTPDNYGFYYSRFPAPEEGKALTAQNVNQQLCFHVIGTPPTEDKVVYERPDEPRLGIYGMCTRDGSYLLIDLVRGSSRKSAIYIQDRDSGGPIQPLFDHHEDEYTYLHNEGPVFFFLTDRDAPKRKIIAVDVRDPAPDRWKVVVPQGKDTIRTATFVAGRFVVEYLHRATAKLVLYKRDGAREKDIELPTHGSISRVSGKPGHTEMFFSFQSFTYPRTIMRYDFEEGELDEWFEPDVDFSPGDYTVRQVAYKSTKDSQYVTMFIVHRKGIKLRGQHPALLYGYGGFNASMTPWFSPTRLVWLEMGGVYAMPNLRGGGEYGEKWHKAGMRENKQRVFDDFIDAAKALVANGYTSHDKLAIAGGSNGGLLVGACMTQRPRLFGACLPSVGVMDMLRFHKFTIGRAWVQEYGSSEDEAMFKVLRAYSPYHNIKKGVTYPPTLVTTADHDDRVVPAHSFKFAARLQAAQNGTPPILIRIETSGGHGGGTALSKVIDERADECAFLSVALRMKLPRRFR